MDTSWLQQLIAAVLRFFSPAGSPRNAGEWKTVGPDVGEYPVVTAGDIAHVAEKVNNGEFKEGKWSLATYKEMFAGRIGRAIVPRTLVVHTTDMRPGTFGALVRNWTSQLGRGNGAHFLIGRTAADGVVQFAPIHRNANHAGGPDCGAIGGMHPNVVSVGVEIDAGGRLKKDTKGFYYADGAKKYYYAPEDVFVDEKGRGWAKVTEYQMTMLRKLWESLKPVLRPWPTGTKTTPGGDLAAEGVQFAATASVSLIGHATINPKHKSDPGPQVMAEIKTWP